MFFIFFFLKNVALFSSKSEVGEGCLRVLQSFCFSQICIYPIISKIEITAVEGLAFQ